MNGRDETLQVNQILDGRYRIVADRVSQDIGASYKAYDMQHDRLVIVLFPQSPDGSPLSLDAVKSSQQAVVDLAQPDLIPYDRGGMSQGQPYLVRQHVEGQTLADLLRYAGRLEHIAAADIAVQICDLLSPAHRAGLVHGGLSPQSVLIGDDGRVMLADMGLISALRPPFSPPGKPWGRFPYLSPEQAAGDEIHPSSDVYVIGLLLYEMLAGQPPFDSADESTLALQHMRQTPTPLQALAPRVPQSLAQIVHKSLAKEPAARYRNAGQVATILRSQIPHTGTENEQLGAGVMEPAIIHPTPATEHLVIPPPHSGPAVQGSYHHGQTGIWVGKPGGVDWLMIALIIAALISVLGLIPLWHSVYRRYSAPPPGSPVFSYSLPGKPHAQNQPFIGVGEGYDGRINVTSAFDCSETGMLPPGKGQGALVPGRVQSGSAGARPWWRPAVHHGQDARFGSLDYGFKGTMC